MKIALACVAALALGFPAFAPAQEFDQSSSSRLMLYMRVSLGSNEQSFMTPRFGLSLDRSVAYVNTSAFSFRTGPHVSLLDWQFNAPRSQQFRFGGAMLSPDGERSAWKSPWLWVGIGAAILGISCATDNFPCDDDGYGGSSGGGGGSGGGGY